METLFYKTYSIKEGDKRVILAIDVDIRWEDESLSRYLDWLFNKQWVDEDPIVHIIGYDTKEHLQKLYLEDQLFIVSKEYYFGE